MGFGLMFVGYFFTYIISLVLVPKILGYVLMMCATVKLSAFDIKFKRCIPVLGGLFLISSYTLLGDVLGWLNIGSSLFNNTILNVVSVVEEVLVVAFHIFLMFAIGSIAIDTGLEKIRFRAMRNLFLICVAEVLYVVVALLPASDIIQAATFVVVMLRFIWIVLDLILLASCYRMICEAGDEDMPEKDVNIPVIKQMETIMRKRDKNAFDSGKKWTEKRREKKEKCQKKD